MMEILKQFMVGYFWVFLVDYVFGFLHEFEKQKYKREETYFNEMTYEQAFLLIVFYMSVNYI